MNMVYVPLLDLTGIDHYWEHEQFYSRGEQMEGLVGAAYAQCA